MLTKITLSVSTGQTLEFKISDASVDDPYILKSVTGLDPPQIDLNVSDNAIDGGKYRNRRVAKREIVFLLEMNPALGSPDPIGVIKDGLYRLLNSGADTDEVTITIYDNYRPTLVTKGFVSKLEMPSSSKTLDAQITIHCPDPYLYKNTFTSITSSPSTFTMNYEGSARTGFHLRVITNSPQTAVTIFRDQFGSSKFMSFHTQFYDPIPTGTEYWITTTNGERGIQVGSGLSFASRLDLLSSDSTWLDISRGPNTFVILNASFTHMSYKAKYWGI